MNYLGPRLSYYGEGKERTLKVGDRVKTIDGREGVVVDDSELVKRTIDIGGKWYSYLGWQLTPVEPERVVWQRCPTDADQAWCIKRSCDGCPHLTPSPGLLQRMGMATWEDEAKDWFVAVDSWTFGWYGHGSGMTLKRYTERDAREECKKDKRARAFKWQDGLR